MIPRRTTILLVLVFCLLVALPQSAQRRKAPTGPRAVAVLENTPRGIRLVPISLMIDGRYYDASLYMANPVPMALDSENVYEVQHGGEAIGDFTVDTAEQWSNGAWAGNGKYVSNEDRNKRAEELAKARAKAATPVKDEDEGPPKLRHKKAGDEVPAGKPAAKPSEKQAQTTPAPEPPKPELQETVADPNRPILKRGKPGGQEQAVTVQSKDLPVKAPPKLPAGLNEVQVAVSDAKDVEARPYTWKWRDADEQQKMRAKIEKLAMQAVSDYAAKNRGPKPGKLEDEDLHAFDLSYNNAPQLILSAKVRAAAPETPAKKGAKTPDFPAVQSDFEYYVTVVAREDIYTDLDKSFVSVTDNKHLDVYPRMQLIDAVDADGNGNGDLLFRSISDGGSSFVLYNASYAQLQEILRVPEPKLQ